MSGLNYPLPPQHARVWVDGEKLFMMFPKLTEIEIAGHPPMEIRAHQLTLPANLMGIKNVRFLLHVRRTMMQPGSVAVRLAQVGHDLSAIRALYDRLMGD